MVIQWSVTTHNGPGRARSGTNLICQLDYRKKKRKRREPSPYNCWVGISPGSYDDFIDSLVEREFPERFHGPLVIRRPLCSKNRSSRIMRTGGDHLGAPAEEFTIIACNTFAHDRREDDAGCDDHYYDIDHHLGFPLETSRRR